MDKRFAVQTSLTGNEIKELRKQLKLTQRDFAVLLGISKPTIERWEVSDKPITGPVVLLIHMLSQNPGYVKELEIPPKELQLRLFYMYKDRICTLIDVDATNQKVEIRNYVDNLQFRAFGRNEKPSYVEYEEFLESRCFPRTRDKLSIVLKDLDLPFYDPLMIIEKTMGKMAEDDFWIKVER